MRLADWMYGDAGPDLQRGTLMEPGLVAIRAELI